MRKMAIAIVMVLAAVFFAGTSFAQELKIAVIDVNKVLNQSDAGQVARKKIEVRYEELKKNIDAKQEEARKLKDEIDKLKVMQNKDKVKDKEEALVAKVADLRKITQDSEREMQERQGEMTREVLKQVEVHVDAVVKAEKFDLVLERSAGGVVYVVESMDITDRVLDLVNKGSQAPAAKKEAGSGK